MARPPLPLKRKIQAGVLTLLCALVALECLSYAAGRYLQKKWCMFAPPNTPEGRIVPNYGEYLRRRDPVVGWPFPDQFGTELFTASGARPSPAFPDTTPETSDVSLYGSSFAQSPNSDLEAWSNVLASLSGRRVANYGQGGYGPDQALLRYRRSPRDHASIVLLAQVSEDLLRILTRNRDLVVYEMWYAYKPRFVLDASGALELIPIPSLSEEDHLRLEGFASPQLVLENETFCPGGPAGATRLSFPYTCSVLRNLGDFRMRAKIAGRPYYAEYFRRGHPLHSLEISREICKAFAAEAKARGQTPLVVILPNREDVVEHRKSKTWCFTPLVEELQSAGVDQLVFGDAFEEKAANRSLDDFYDKSGHFRPETDRLLAEAVFAKLKTLPAWDAMQGGSSR